MTREDLLCYFVRPSSIVMHSSNYLRTPGNTGEISTFLHKRSSGSRKPWLRGNAITQRYFARFITKSIAIVVHVHAHATACKRSRRHWPTPKKSFPLTRQKIAQRIISQIRKLFVNNSIGSRRPGGISHARKELSRECFVFIGGV